MFESRQAEEETRVILLKRPCEAVLLISYDASIRPLLTQRTVNLNPLFQGLARRGW